MAPEYVFRRIAAGDLPLVQRWLETPDVVRWWGRPRLCLATFQPS
jgi:hypothetical protein